MRVSVLSSGSKGNATFLEIGGKKFLLDAGRNFKYLKTMLETLDVDIKTIDYIIISHDHKDHTTALKTLLSKTKATVIISEKVFYEIDDLKEYTNIIICENELVLDDVKIVSFRSSHDAIDSRNFVIEGEGKKIAYITDTGYINNKYFRLLHNLDIYLFESNHDIELLQHGPYPAWLKKRVLSDEGHLSNKLASFYLSKLVGDRTKKIILIHLSETNNLESIALETIKNTFSEYNVDFSNIICARQNEKTEVIEI